MRKFTKSIFTLGALFVGLNLVASNQHLLAQTSKTGNYGNTTCEFGGRVGKVVFKNSSAYPINVKLWHPNSNSIYTTQKVQGNTSIDFGINVGDDWGIQLGSSQVKCIGDVSNWRNNTFNVDSATFY